MVISNAFLQLMTNNITSLHFSLRFPQSNSFLWFVDDVWICGPCHVILMRDLILFKNSSLLFLILLNFIPLNFSLSLSFSISLSFVCSGCSNGICQMQPTCNPPSITNCKPFFFPHFWNFILCHISLSLIKSNSYKSSACKSGAMLARNHSHGSHFYLHHCCKGHHSKQNAFSQKTQEKFL